VAVERPEMPMLHCLGFDPGEDTGWAYVRAPLRLLAAQGFAGSVFDTNFRMVSGAVDCRKEISGVTAMVDITRHVWLEVDQEFGDLFLVCFEDFILLRLGSDRALLSPVRLTAAYRDRMREFRYPFLRTSPSDAKRIITDQRLRTWNLYEPGPDHPRDAARQAIIGARKWAGNELGTFRRWVADWQWCDG
jgi:hypothetical protein